MKTVHCIVCHYMYIKSIYVMDEIFSGLICHIIRDRPGRIFDPISPGSLEVLRWMIDKMATKVHAVYGITGRR